MRSKYLAALKRIWMERSLREQRLLLAMAVIVAPSLLVFGILQPLELAVSRNREAALRLEGQVMAVEQLAAEASKLSGKTAMTPLSARSLQTVIEATMDRAAFARDEVKLAVEGDAGVRLSGEAGFDAWMRLAGMLERESQVHVVRMTATPSDHPGRIKLDAVLVHAGGEA
ncbi:type II secretion system protein GspM [Paludibacterium paludis]|uniref:Type II secretion system protein M n=1 Tax=Paludibacterium paludis TaxID=1225769 RepID=A0A918NZ00_9NEIS|nr:type II secretion system protein GspM [Paludibacterium paludis]GGY08092.1 hypothetical protein GCM10011289_08390 [Paludibacterium paludis]